MSTVLEDLRHTTHRAATAFRKMLNPILGAKARDAILEAARGGEIDYKALAKACEGLASGDVHKNVERAKARIAAAHDLEECPNTERRIAEMRVHRDKIKAECDVEIQRAQTIIAAARQRYAKESGADEMDRLSRELYANRARAQSVLMSTADPTIHQHNASVSGQITSLQAEISASRRKIGSPAECQAKIDDLRERIAEAAGNTEAQAALQIDLAAAEAEQERRAEVQAKIEAAQREIADLEAKSEKILARVYDPDNMALTVTPVKPAR